MTWLRWLDPNRGSRRHDMLLIISYMIVVCVPVAVLIAVRVQS